MPVALDYQLTYGGVPFFADAPRVFRVTPEGSSNSPHVAPRKHQPDDDLLRDIDRRFPFAFMQEFSYPLSYPGRTVGHLARPTQMLDEVSENLRVGDYYYPVGASRWSVFRGLMTSSCYRRILADSNGGRTPLSLVMKAVPTYGAVTNRTFQISTPLYLLPGRPLGETEGTDDGLYLITLVDERFSWQYTPASLHVSGSTTWVDLLNSLVSTLGITLSYSTIASVYGQPDPDSQLWTNNESASLLLDAVAANIGRQVVRKYDGTYRLYTTPESVALARVSRSFSGTLLRQAGGDMFQSGGALPAGDLRQARQGIAPSVVVVDFPKYVTGSDPVPHFYDPRTGTGWFKDSYGDTYSVPVPITSGGTFTSGLTGAGLHTIHETAKALFTTEANALGGTPTNVQGLRDLAVQVASDYWSSQLGSGLDESYLGILDWDPDGLHDVLFTYSQVARGAYTRVMRSEWNCVISHLQHGTPSGGDPPAGGGPWSLTARHVPGEVPTGTLGSTLTSGGTSVILTGGTFFPTDRRFKATVGTEVVLGSLTGNVMTVLSRGMDGTTQQAWPLGTVVTPVPGQPVYQTNLLTAGKGLFTAPNAHTAGGVRESVLLSPVRTIKVTSQTGSLVSGVTYYPGEIYDWSPTGLLMQGTCLVASRNGATPVADALYEGHLAGDGPGAPLYLVSHQPGSVADPDPDPPGDTTIINNYFDETTNIYNSPVTNNYLNVVNNTFNNVVNNTFNNTVINNYVTNIFIYGGGLYFCGMWFDCSCDMIIIGSQGGTSVSDLVLPGGGACIVYRTVVIGGGGATITGIVPGGHGHTIGIVNLGDNDLVLSDNSILSQEANRFQFGGDVTIGANGMVRLWYDAGADVGGAVPVVKGWRAYGVSVTGGGGDPGDGGNGGVKYERFFYSIGREYPVGHPDGLGWLSNNDNLESNYVYCFPFMSAKKRTLGQIRMVYHHTATPDPLYKIYFALYTNNQDSQLGPGAKVWESGPLDATAPTQDLIATAGFVMEGNTLYWVAVGANSSALFPGGSGIDTHIGSWPVLGTTGGAPIVGLRFFYDIDLVGGLPAQPAAGSTDMIGATFDIRLVFSN